MDDPTRRCENDTGNETRLPRPPIPSGGLIFFSAESHRHVRPACDFSPANQASYGLTSNTTPAFIDPPENVVP